MQLVVAGFGGGPGGRVEPGAGFPAAAQVVLDDRGHPDRGHPGHLPGRRAAQPSPDQCGLGDGEQRAQTGEVLEDGKIVEMWLFSGDQTAEDAFWGR
ncbi:hypothetical protein P1P75_10180 [Streptomyces sp. ID05-39B]|uniref:hypothetical protein n=1 Tax=Streptomyces sp. ID05-39B TaxID=3028664 RepID=UPI0029A52094|nr:hypothetical protein [Streptomyces sp. ID05-39B]MDX3526799.1 hypothetical protein [Streptomyces sp. ID05-39B]